MYMLMLLSTLSELQEAIWWVVHHCTKLWGLYRMGDQNQKQVGPSLKIAKETKTKSVITRETD